MSEFHRPQSIEDALSLLAEDADATSLLAGGTSLVPSFSHAAYRAPRRIIYLGEVADLRTIASSGENLTIGALATLADLCASDLVRKHAQSLAQAAGVLASPQVRNRGTIGGNLAAGRCGAELAVPLSAFDSRVVVRREGGTRRISFQEFFGDNGTPALRADEIIVSVEIPTHWRASQYLRLARRQAIAPPIVSVSVALGTEARIAIGNVAKRPVLLSDASAQTVERAVREALTPYSDLQAPGWYRSATAGVLARRALESVSA